MSNIFTRTPYDLDQTQLADIARKSKNDYMLNLINGENSNVCQSSIAPRNAVSEVNRPLNSNGYLDLGNKTDVENKLQNRHLPLNSLDRTNQDYKNIKTSSNKECLDIEETLADTRLTHPISDYREMRTDKYNTVPFLHMNPQNVMVKNDMWHNTLDRHGKTSRMDTKDEIMRTKSTTITRNKDFTTMFSGLLPKRN